MQPYVNVCRADAIPLGESRMFVIADRRIGIFNIGGEYFALDDHCSHAGASLAHGIIDKDVVACRIHHWRFSIRNGQYLDADKPSCNVQSYSVRIVDEMIQVAI